MSLSMVDYRIDPDDPLPRYYQVYTSLQERILAEEFSAGDALPSERQLVKDYGVSRITIIKAMDLLERDGLIEQQQGRGSFVVDHQDQQCSEACYRVAFCMPAFPDSFMMSVLIGATRVAMREGVQLHLIGAEREDREAFRLREAVAGGADGLLLFPFSRYADPNLYRELRDARYPLVLLDRYYRDQPTDWVVFDDEQAGYQLTRALIAQGHRRIAIFPGHEVSISSVRHRIQGYQRALEEAGCEFEEDMICVDVYSELYPAVVNKLQASYVRLFSHLRKGQFTAMIAINHFVALQMAIDMMRIRTELLQAANGTGEELHNSEFEIAIGAFSHDQYAQGHSSLTGLTAVALQSGELLGEAGMAMLVRRLTEGPSLPLQHQLVPMEIVTSAPPLGESS